MKSYCLNKINVLKFLTLSLLSFILIFSILLLTSLGLNIIFLEISFILFAIFFVSYIYPLILKKSRSIIEIKISKTKVIIEEKSYSIKNIEKINLKYRFLIFPKLKIKFDDGRVINFHVEKFRKDYFEFESAIK